MSHYRKESDMVKAFQKADKDGSGGLNLDEYVSLFREQGVNLSMEDAEVAFKEKDKDGDGKVWLHEI